MKKTALLLFVAAAIISFYRLPTSVFDADQEYFALSGKKILSGDLTLIGQQTGVGELYHAPLFNYLVALAIWVFHGNPLVVNGIGALFATVTVPALFLLGSKIISRKGAFFASLLALFSVSFFGLAAYGENVPPLTLLTLLFLCVLQTMKNGLRKSVFLGAIVGLTFHFHILGVMLIIPLLFTGFAWAPSFLFFVSPLILFDIRNNFLLLRHSLRFVEDSPTIPTLIGYRLHTYLISLADLIHIGFSATVYIPLVAGIFVWGMLQPHISSWIKLTLLSPLLFFLFYKGHLVPYYSIIAWTPFLLIVGEFLSWIIARRNVVLHICLGVYFVALALGKIHQLITWDPLRSIDKKIAALQFIKNRIGERPVYISRTMEWGTNFGFDYLIPYVGINDTKDPRDVAYTLVIPVHFQGIQPDAQFGDIGVVLPPQK